MLMTRHDLTPPRNTINPQPRRLKGVLNGTGLHYGINLNWDGTRLNGRFGGLLLGENVQLERFKDTLLGTVTGGTFRLAVHARFMPEEHDLRVGRLELHLAGLRYLGTAIMTIHPDCVTGTGEANGVSFEIKLGLNETLLEGRIGSSDSEQHVRLERNDLPNFVLVTAALLADTATREVSRTLLESLDRMRES
jgi:hypothetical protein